MLGMALVNEGNLDGSGTRVRDVPEAGARRAERRAGEGDSVDAAEEVSSS